MVRFFCPFVASASVCCWSHTFNTNVKANVCADFTKIITKIFCTGLTVWLSPAGVFAPTLFSKAYGHLVCDACTDSSGNSTSNSSGPFVCRNCHYDLVSVDIQKERKIQTIYGIVSCVMQYYFFSNSKMVHCSTTTLSKIFFLIYILTVFL